MNIAAWRASLRIARRDALRHKGRSALVIAMIALPVVGVTGIDVMVHSAELTTTEKLDRELGAADAMVIPTGLERILQSPDGRDWVPADDGGKSMPDQQEPQTQQDLAAALPTGSRLLTIVGTDAKVRAADGGVQRNDAQEIDYTDPLAAGLYRQVSGRAPATPDEVVLTPRLGHELHLAVGDTLRTVDPERTYTIVGIVRSHWYRNNAVLIGLPGALTGGDPNSGRARYLVSTPHPLTWDDVKELNARGTLVTARSVALNPPGRADVPYYQDRQVQNGPPPAVIAAMVIAIGMALLEVVLLAGPAFAVGARRMRRQLGLVAAGGGERRHVRDIVLAGGVVLGLTGGVVGAAVGAVGGIIGRSLVLRYSTSDFGGIHLHPLEIVGIALVGLVTGVLAALVPALSMARLDIVSALAGRRGALRTAKRWPAVGTIMIAAGVALAAYGATTHISNNDYYGAAYRRHAFLVLGGAILTELGLVMCTGALVGLVGRAGARLSATPRMALRDASRNRSRTAPAVAAIMAAVAGTIAVVVIQTSLQAQDKATYVPQVRSGQALVRLTDAREAGNADRIADALQNTLPARSVDVLEGLGTNGCGPQEDCTFVAVATFGSGRSGEHDGGVVTGNAGTLRALTGVDDPKAVQTLNEGGMVVFDGQHLRDGKATVSIVRTRNSGSEPEPTHALPGSHVAVRAIADEEHHDLTGYLLSSPISGVVGVVSPETAAKFGLTPAPFTVLADTTHMPTKEEEKAARRAVALAGSTEELYVERGFRPTSNVWMLILLGGAGVITLGASGIVTGLAAADSRADLTTLAAIGAAPRMRRRLMAASAAITAFLGSVLGMVAGFVPAIGLLRVRDSGPHLGTTVVLPWAQLSAIVIGIPLLAGLFAWAFTRSRLPMPRRTA